MQWKENVFQVILYLPFLQKEKNCFKQITSLLWHFWVQVSYSIKAHLCCCLMEGSSKNLGFLRYVERHDVNSLDDFLVKEQQHWWLASLVSLGFVSDTFSKQVPVLPSCNNTTPELHVQSHVLGKGLDTSLPQLILLKPFLWNNNTFMEYSALCMLLGRSQLELCAHSLTLHFQCHTLKN